MIVSATRHRIKFPWSVWLGEFTAFVRAGGGERPRHRRKHPFPLTAASRPACIAVLESATCCLAALLTAGLPTSARAESVTPAIVVATSSSRHAISYASFITEASRRFAIPEQWIRAVMQVESNFNAYAVSPRGARGLMQIMPGTWVELSVHHGLGLDPFDPRDNILAGSAYLKAMYDRFGSAGFLAAYHAGPARYEQHLATGRPLPPETTAYVAAVTPLLGDEQTKQTAFRIKRAIPWRQAPLFVERTGTR